MSALESPRMEVQALFDSLYRPRRLPGRAARHPTILLYRNLFRSFAQFLARPPLVADLDEDTLAAYLAWLTRRKLSNYTVNLHRARLLSLASFAWRRRLLDTMPEVARLPEWETERTVYSPQQVALLAAAARQVRGLHLGLPRSQFLVAAVLLAYDTGLRAGALYGLRLADVDMAAMTVTARDVTQKTRKTQRLRFSPQTAAVLASIMQPPRELLLPWPATVDSRYYWLHRLLRLAGLPDTRRDLWQRIRRTTLSLADRYGADAVRQAGHSDRRTTERYYLAEPDWVEAADVLPRPPLGMAQLLLF
jgi:integrase